MRAVPQKPTHSQVPPGYSERRLHLKFQEGTAIRLRGQEFVSEVGVDLSALQQVLAGFPQARSERLFSLPEGVLAAETASIQAEAVREIADFNLYYRIVVPTSDEIEALLDGLNSLPIVEIAYPQPLPAPPPVTPDFVGLQGYRGPAPGGIDAHFAASVPGGLGDRAKIIDIEYSWNQTHEDITKAGLPGALIPNRTPVDPFSNTDHGTAVLGELSADDNGFGVTGLVPNASLGMVNAFNAEDGYDLQDSIFIAHQNLSPGDVMLIEQQAPGAFGGCGQSQIGCVAVEWVPAYYDAIVAATADGINVVEAAGNGSQNLDDPAYGSPFPGSRPDSGAIIVGAGGSPNCMDYPQPTRSRLEFSTFGSRVDLQGWGECVVTAGYGDLQGASQTNDAYTAHFGGTSSASPIVASAAASLSSALEEANGVPPTPEDVRARLIATGTPQNFSSSGALTGEIGALPDLRIALAIAAPPSADLSILKSDSLDPVAVSTPLTYTLSVSNAGPNAAAVVVVTDTLPVGVSFQSADAGCTNTSGTVTCNIGALANGATITRQIVVTAPSASSSLTNTASVTSSTADPSIGNNSDTETTVVNAVSHLLAISVVGQGSVESNPAGISCPTDCSENYAGGNVSLTPHAAAGWQFSGWSGACTGSEACSVTMDQERSVTATFAQPSACTIPGNGGNNTLVGTPGDDVICGFGGDDTLYGRGGNDLILGGLGNDQLVGGIGNDRITGGLGDDVIDGSDGDDNIDAGQGNDTVQGGLGNDTMLGGPDLDTLSYAAGASGVTVSLAITGLPQDTVGAGTDRLDDHDFEILIGTANPDSLTGNPGRNLIKGGGGNDLISGGEGLDILIGGTSNDSLFGGAGNDVLSGEQGNDALNGGTNRDLCLGGTDIDSGTACERSVGIP